MTFTKKKEYKMRKSELETLIRQMIEEARAGEISSVVPGKVIKKMADTWKGFDPVNATLGHEKFKGGEWESTAERLAYRAKDLGSSQAYILTDEDGKFIASVIASPTKGYEIITADGTSVNAPTTAGVKKFVNKLPGGTNPVMQRVDTGTSWNTRDTSRASIASSREPGYGPEPTPERKAKTRAFQKFIDKKFSEQSQDTLDMVLQYITDNQEEILKKIAEGYGSIDLSPLRSKMDYMSGERSEGIKSRYDLQSEYGEKFAEARRRAKGL
jgi:hypothetical protein